MLIINNLKSLSKFIDFLENSVPKPDSVLDGINSSLDDVLELGIVLVSQMGDQMGSLGTMEATVNFNVSVEVPLQSWAVNLAIVEGLDDLGEHLGNGVLSSEEELASSVGDGSEDGLACVLVELLDVGWAIGSIDSLLNVLIGVLIVGHLGNLADVVLNWLRISTNLIHSLDVELEMGEILPINIGVISLLSDDDLVDESCGIDVSTWSPEPSGVGDVPLEILDQ